MFTKLFVDIAGFFFVFGFIGLLFYYLLMVVGVW